MFIIKNNINDINTHMYKCRKCYIFIYTVSVYNIIYIYITAILYDLFTILYCIMYDNSKVITVDFLPIKYNIKIKMLQPSIHSEVVNTLK